MKNFLLQVFSFIAFFMVGACTQVYAISEYCELMIGSGNNEVAMTWVTDKAGNVQISIADVSGEDPAQTAFRAAMAINSFNVNGGSAATYFKVSYAGAVCTLELLDPTNRPAMGATITFNGVMEYKTALDGNAFPTVSLSYTYGSTCAELATPVITNLTQEGVITFSTVEGASYYTASVLYKDNVLYQQTVKSGDQIYFRPYIVESTTYQVVVEAKAGNKFSDPSAPKDWTLTGKASNLPMSLVCESLVQGFIDPTKQAYLSFETDQATGELTIHVMADETHEDSLTYFRNTGMTPDGFLYDGEKMSLYFTRKDASADGKKDIVYVPNTEGEHVPVFGHTITFNADKKENTNYVEWYVDGMANAPFASTYSYEYIYGTNCIDPTTLLATPENLAVTQAGVVTFSAVEHAGRYEVEVSDADDVLLTQLMTSGDAIARDESIVEGFVYYVRVRALPELGDAVYRTSDWSEVVEWDLTSVHTGMQEQSAISNQQSKLMLDGQMYIVVSGEVYSLLGNLIK